MADSVAYVVECYCGETIYAAMEPRNPFIVGKREIMYWPNIHHPNCHDPITHCVGCGRKIAEVEDEQYQEAMDYL